MKKDDLFCLDETNEEWMKIMQHVEIRRLGSNQELQKSFENVRKAVLSAIAVAEKKSEYSKDSIWGKYVARKFIHTFGPLYYMVANTKGLQRAKNF